MTAAALEPRVTTLEDAMRELAIQSTRTQAELEHLSRDLRGFKDEMAAFKDEMRYFKDEMQDFKDEMRGFKDEMQGFKDEMQGFKDEMQDFKDEMQDFKDEMQDFKDEMKDFKDEMKDFKDEMRGFKDETRREHRELNRKWGEMANRLGTIVEDLVSPSLPRVVQETFGEDIIDLSVRRKRKLPDGRVQEFDAIALTPTLVCLNSTKSTLHSAHVDALIDEIERLREYFPEYRDIPVVGILATLNVDDSVLRRASRQGFLVLAVGDELMEVRNPPGFVPKRW